MTLLQYSITSLNISVEQSWLYQQENNYDAIFLKETDYIEGKPLGHFKNWKNRMFTNLWSNGLVVKLLDSQSRGPMF